jgi:hypothetical protein
VCSEDPIRPLNGDRKFGATACVKEKFCCNGSSEDAAHACSEVAIYALLSECKRGATPCEADSAAACGADKSCYDGQHADSAKACSEDPINFLTSAGKNGATPCEADRFCYEGRVKKRPRHVWKNQTTP